MRRMLPVFLIAVSALGLSLIVPAGAVDYPVITGTLTVTGGTGSPTNQVSPGDRIFIAGGGFAPGSAVQLTFHTTPILLATVHADAAGSIDTMVTVPQGVFNGTHTIEAIGGAPGGGSVVLTRMVALVGGMPTPGGLAFTGADVLGWIAIGLAAIVLGFGLLKLRRRRQYV